jgi:MinD-like ATPase involved in chromosome partitioning or flagellar assembly
MVDPLMIPSGVHVIDAAPYNTPLTRSATAEMLDNSRNKYPFTVVDAATNVEDAGMTSIARADRVVVVTLGTPQGLGAAQTALGRLRPRVGTPMQPGVVLTVLMPPGASRSSVQSSAEQLAQAIGGTAVLVPYDPALAAGGRLDASRLTADTRRGYLDLAAAITAHG